jgi:LCP family protein required for cell wall assembly
VSRRRNVRGLLIAGAIALALLLYTFFPVGRPNLRAPRSSLPPIPLDDARFLIVGLTQDEHRTDTIMVVQWDDLRGQARILGVPRDIGVPVAGIGTTKIVHAYATGGIGRTRVAVANYLGLSIPHYFVFSLPALRHLVDLIGGVALTVEKRMVYVDHKQGLFIDLYPGPQVLDGAHAEQYVRFRNDRESDIGRIRRQQQFLQAALASIRRPSVWIQLPQIVGVARNEVLTDLTGAQLLDWVRRVEGITPDAISAYTFAGQTVRKWDALERMPLDFWEPTPADQEAKIRWLRTGEVPPVTEP